MGILLPPVSQVTNNHINHTQHHRNRSLDSALQRIPEVSSVPKDDSQAQDPAFTPLALVAASAHTNI